MDIRRKGIMVEGTLPRKGWVVHYCSVSCLNTAVSPDGEGRLLSENLGSEVRPPCSFYGPLVLDVACLWTHHLQAIRSKEIPCVGFVQLRVIAKQCNRCGVTTSAHFGGAAHQFIVLAWDDLCGKHSRDLLGRQTLLPKGIRTVARLNP